MTREEWAREFVAGKAQREDVFVDAGLCELGALTTVPVQFLPGIYLALKRWSGYGDCGELGALSREVAMRYIYAQMGEVQQHHMDCLVAMLDRAQAEWERIGE